MYAVILAGGFGKRLRPLTDDKPKPLVEVAGKPILMWQIEWLKRQGVTDFVLAVGYLGGKIFDYVGDGAHLGVRVHYSVEREPLGTGGAIKNALRFVEGDTFIVVNGDILTNLSISRLVESLGGHVIGAIALTPLRSPYGIVDVNEAGNIVEFREKPTLPYLINAGVYAFKKDIASYLPDRGDIEVSAFPRLAREGRLKGVKYLKAYWKSIDTIKDLEEAEKTLNEQDVFSSIIEE